MSGDAVLVGVAIAIPQPHATVLANWRRDVGDPAADLVFPHVTLLPPTAVSADSMPLTTRLRTSALSSPSVSLRKRMSGAWATRTPPL